MYYRQVLEINKYNQISIENYIKQNYANMIIDESDNIKKEKTIEKSYNFDDTITYYEKRDDNFIVGIIDKNLNDLVSIETELFKIRPSRAKILDKKRGTGIPTLKGAVCSSKDKDYLINLIKKLPNITDTEINNIKKMTRENICNEIKNKLLYLEKYATSKDNNKITYVMIPSDHPIYPFPYNLEDRIKFIIKNINKNVSSDINILVKKKTDKPNIIYEMTFQNNKSIKDDQKIIESYGFTLTDNLWTNVLT